MLPEAVVSPAASSPAFWAGCSGFCLAEAVLRSPSPEVFPSDGIPPVFPPSFGCEIK